MNFTDLFFIESWHNCSFFSRHIGLDRRIRWLEQELTTKA